MPEAGVGRAGSTGEARGSVGRVGECGRCVERYAQMPAATARSRTRLRARYASFPVRMEHPSAAGVRDFETAC